MRTREGRRGLLFICILAVVLLALLLLSFGLGRYAVPPAEVIRILLARIFPVTPSWTEHMETAVINIRLPRILLACMVGGCLSAAGTAYQSVFRNPMAAPDILGACFGAALAILLGFSRSGVTALAFVSSLLSVALVYAIARRAKGNPVTMLLLAGVMIGSLFSACTSYVKLVADPTNQLPAITYWLMGSLSGTRMNAVGFAAVPMLIGLVPLLALRWRINLLTLDEEEARSMGVNTGRLRLVVILCATVLTAACVAVSGMIGWVGLVIPHLSRKLVGSNCRYLLPASTIFGAIFLLLVDNISRNLLATEIPIGILTAFVGAPFFLYLMTRKEQLL